MVHITLACNLINMYAGGLFAVVDGHFNAGCCIAVFSAGSPKAVLCIGQHSTAAALSSVLTAHTQGLSAEGA